MGVHIFIAVGVVIFFILLKSYSNKQKRLPPGPYRFPVIGSMLQVALADVKNPHLALEKLSKKYGDVMGYGCGVYYSVVLSSYDKMKALLSNKELCVQRFPFPFVSDRNFHELDLGIIWSVGDNWNQIRRYSVKTLRAVQRKMSMEEVMQVEMSDLASRVLSHAKMNGGTFQLDQNLLNGTSVNVLWSFVGGFTFSSDDDHVQKHLKHNDTLMEVIAPTTLYNYFPFLKEWFPNWSGLVQHLGIHSDMQTFIRGMINDATQQRSQKDDPNRKAESFIEAFLDKIDENVGDPNTVFTEKQLVVILMDLFMAGSDTISKLMEWTLMYLTLYPDIQEKAWEEIQKNGIPAKLANWANYPYLKAMLLETLRHSNMTPLPAPRTTVTDVEFEGFIIPKGTIVSWNMTSVFKDQIFWGDPDNYRPERFLNPTNNQEIIREKAERVAIFGFGSRVCPGESYVAEMFLIFVSTILTNLNLKSIPGKEPIPKISKFSSVLAPAKFIMNIVPRSE